MRFILIITLLLAALAASSPIDLTHRLVNRPPPSLETRVRRSEQLVKGRRIEPPKLALNLRKGEYICGNKVCKLRPGDKPPCELCQYPV